MKKLSILLIIVILILSGCTGNKTTNQSTTQSSIANSPATEADNDSNSTNDTNTEEKISVNSANTETLTGSDWCIPGVKITENGEEFTIAGITTFENKDNICKAERPTKGGSSVIYFNEEYINKESGAFFAAKSTSSGENAHSEAKAVVTVGK